MATSCSRAASKFGRFFFGYAVNRSSNVLNQWAGKGHLYTQVVSCASIHNDSRRHHPQSSRNFRVQQDQDDEDELYDVDEDDLDDLRQKHREAARTQHASSEGLKFSDFEISGKLKNRLEQLGYKEPFEIQAKTLPHTLGNRDVIGRALTGSGKTMAFSIPIVQKLQGRKRGRTKSPVAIVISPTRELCLQIHKSIQELDPGVRCAALYGGDPYHRQEMVIDRGIDVVCATPGRLNDHIERGNIMIDELEFLCLDEADELLTPNFKEQIENILMESPREKQVMLFSATLPPNITQITRQYMNDPVHVDIAGSQKLTTPLSVKHICMKAPSFHHITLVKHLLDQYEAERCIVFMATKVQCKEATNKLQAMGLKAEAIHSDCTQRRRENIMKAFRKGLIKVLVATDVAARGLDIPETDLIIQVEPPKNGTDFYIHRSGRTGRAGRDGVAVLLHSGRDWFLVKEIERLVKLEHVEAPDMNKYMVQDILERVKKVRENDIKNILPQLEELDLAPPKGKIILAAAMSILMNGGMEKSAPESRFERTSFRNDRFNNRFDRNDRYSRNYDSYDRSNSRFSGHRKPFRRDRRDFSDEWEDEPRNYRGKGFSRRGLADEDDDDF
ncbi:unnamed protein product [Owenia fusiformis]|uniref:Uncharacterized protein n=1 Tax=Owenia fusiformis TaxID=6347 RepID=A0A8J1UR80_OWEFU|nr:unnamed protein product [Owenia fusiformis]